MGIDCDECRDRVRANGGGIFYNAVKRDFPLKDFVHVVKMLICYL